MLLDDWYDWWRLALFLVCSVCLLILAYKFIHERKTWGERKRDQWFLLLMWCLAAWEMQIEGVLRDTELRFRLVFVTAASIVSLKLLTKKKNWSGEDV